jgi:hypothetical protein
MWGMNQMSAQVFATLVVSRQRHYFEIFENGQTQIRNTQLVMP